MLFLVLKLNTEEGAANETTHLLIFSECIKKIKETKQWNYRWEKIVKELEENKLIVTKNTSMRIRFILEIYVYSRK